MTTSRSGADMIALASQADLRSNLLDAFFLPEDGEWFWRIMEGKIQPHLYCSICWRYCHLLRFPAKQGHKKTMKISVGTHLAPDELRVIQIHYLCE